MQKLASKCMAFQNEFKLVFVEKSVTKMYSCGSFHIIVVSFFGLMIHMREEMQFREEMQLKVMQ